MLSAAPPTQAAAEQPAAATESGEASSAPASFVGAPAAIPAAHGPSASELAFGARAPADDLRPDQRGYYEQILATTPGVTPKRAHEIAAKSRPLTPADRAAVRAVQQQIATMKPRRIDDPKNPNLVQIEVAFDGSGDDRAQSAPDTETNPALLDEQFAGRKHYERGVATDNGLAGEFEMATGVGLQHRIDGAYTNLVEQINAVKSENPKAQVVLVVTGFSRGATAARAFVNQLDQRGVPVLSSKQPDGSFAQHYEAPRIGVMVLFDTVQMTAFGHYDTSIPANAENVLHITARDEHRTTFPLTRATDPNRPDDTRITEVAMPGSHPDIGGGNPNAYSRISEQIARQYMVNAGVEMKPQDPASVVDIDDPSLRLHNSGDAWFGLPRPVETNHNPR